MARFSILPFLLLLLAIALPLLLAVSGRAIPTTTEVDCVQRTHVSSGDDQNVDVDNNGSFPSDDVVELESDTNEQLAGDHEVLFFDNEAASMPNEDELELESGSDEQLADDEGLFADEAASSMANDDVDVELESDTDEQLADEGFFEDEADDSMSGDDMEIESDHIDDVQLDDNEGSIEDDEDEDGSMPSDDEDVKLECGTDDDEQLDDNQGFLEDEAAAGSMPADMELENNTDIEPLEADEGSIEDEDEDEDEAGYILMPTDRHTDYVNEGNLGIPVGNVVTQAFFNSIIGKAAPSCKGKKFYTRDAFVRAARSYPSFGQLKPDDAAKREIAAFFAHVTHETGSLCYIEEIKKSTYCDPNTARQWPCAPRKQYYGRGPLQLTWNYNYGLFGKENRLDTLRNPDLVARNPVVAWRASLWFWMKNVRPVLGRGFGATIRAINGALECNGKNPAAVRARVNFYTDYCKRFRVAPGPNLTC